MLHRAASRECGQGLVQLVCRNCGWRTRTDILPDTAIKEFREHQRERERHQTEKEGVLVPRATWTTVGDTQVYHEEVAVIRVWARPNPRKA